MDTIMDNRIIDIHTHVLPGVDDGSKTIEESLEIINYLKSIGIYDIVLTSHYIKGTKYEYNNFSRNNILNELESRLEDKNVNLYLGNEVFLCEEVIELFNNKEITTINNSKYMLVELPLANYLKNFQNILCELNEHGIIPIIAHPERYRFIQNDKTKVRELLEFDTLLQINIDSLIGKYGKKAKKISKWLLKKGLVQFVATDVHHVGNRKELEKSYKKLKRIVGKEKYNELTFINPKRVLENKGVIGNLDYFRKEKTW